ncbi:hypothetical protein T02_3059 [Trichinella nativa]|uniref:Uncharacterized protein n=1 Tax=Trichinella nativa TaxID=6335 RepID=A0A0V1LKC6_9BILA|nr:hypothetical protein T02_3059 [Trichinella nativa]
MLTVVKNIRFALNFLNKYQKKKKEKGQSDMTKVNGKASEVGLLGRKFDIIQGMLNFLTDLKQAAAPRSSCDVEKKQCN